MKNKEYMLKELKDKTGRLDEECSIIDEILDEHFVIGRNNKSKIVDSFMEKLGVSESEADELYNICCEIIVKGIFK